MAITNKIEMITITTINSSSENPAGSLRPTRGDDGLNGAPL
jgi:hypothetical protein